MHRTKLPLVDSARAYCVCYIASRSLAFFLPNASRWDQFKTFFGPKRIESFKDILALIPDQADLGASVAKTPIGGIRALALQVKVAFMPQPEFVAFRESELALLKSTFADFLIRLEEPLPDIAKLSCIRRDFERCLMLIEMKWPKSRVWNRLQVSIDYYCRNPALGPAFEIDDIVASVLAR